MRRRRVLVATTVAGVAAVVALVIALIVATSGDSSTPSARKTSGTPSTSTSAAPSASGSSSAAAQPRYPCTWTKDGAPSKKGTQPPPDTMADLAGKFTVSVATNRGPMTFSFDRSDAPCAVENFVSLVKQGFYDRTPCHRLTTEGIYIVQCGDPTGTGKGGPGYTINDEGTGTETYKAGSIAMARTEAPDSGGSQFFIVYKDSPGLQRGLGLQQYTEFGTVSKGLDVVQKVAAGGAVPTGDGKPKLPLTIEAMTTTATTSDQTNN